jgi:ABC-2 type transport system permease protein
MFSSIDFRQVVILTRYALISEWRMASLRSFGRRRKMSRAWAYWTMVTYLAFGALTIRLFYGGATGEVYITAAGLFMSYAAFVTASNIFLAFGTGFLSPDEAQIVSPLPVTSETFFFSRLAVLICYTTAISLLLSIGPFIGLEFFISSYGLLANLALVFATTLSSVAAAMTVIVIYGLMLGKLRQSAMSKAIGYVQFVGSFITAISFVALSRFEYKIDLHALTLSAQPLLALVPSFWFASLAGVAAGVTGSLNLTLALCAALFLAGLSAASHILLAKKYQSEISELATSSAMSAKAKKSSRDGIVFRSFIRMARSDEARGVFMLLRAQFRYDSKFRMQLLAMLPVTVIYLVMAVLGGGIVDPFTGKLSGVMRANMLYLVALLMPLIIMQAISQSENYKAAWLFFAAPLDRTKLLLAVRNAILVTIVLPYLVVLSIVLSQFMPWTHAAMHVLVLAAVGGFIFQIYFMLAAKMPFAQPRRPNRGGVAMFAGVFLFMFLAIAILGLEIYFGYSSPERYWPSFALLVTLSALLERAVQARIRKKLAREEFEG